MQIQPSDIMMKVVSALFTRSDLMAQQHQGLHRKFSSPLFRSCSQLLYLAEPESKVDDRSSYFTFFVQMFQAACYRRVFYFKIINFKYSEALLNCITTDKWIAKPAHYAIILLQTVPVYVFPAVPLSHQPTITFAFPLFSVPQ